jgi:hypothetical protein
MIRVAENKIFDASGLLARNVQGYRCTYGPILSLPFFNGPDASKTFGAGTMVMTFGTTNHAKSTKGVL